MTKPINTKKRNLKDLFKRAGKLRISALPSRAIAGGKKLSSINKLILGVAAVLLIGTAGFIGLAVQKNMSAEAFALIITLLSNILLSVALLGITARLVRGRSG